MKLQFVFAVIFALFAGPTSALAVTHISHDYESILNGIPLNNACLTATHVQTIKGVQVCLEKKEVVVRDQGIESVDYVCLKWAAQALSYSRKYSVKRCVEVVSDEATVGCKKFSSVEKFLPNTITIRTWTENGEYNTYPGAASEFTFPACK